MLLKPAPIIIHQDVSPGITRVHGRSWHHARSKAGDSIQSPQECWEEVGRRQRVGQMWLLEQPGLCSVHTFACQRLGKIQHVFVSTLGSRCSDNQSTSDAQTTAIWGEYVTPESGTFFTHEQGRSLTETSMHLLCKALSFVFFNFF